MSRIADHKDVKPVIEASQSIGAKISALRIKHLMVLAGTGIALAIATEVELLALVMFIDWWIELPWGLRLLFLIGQVCLVGFILFRFVFHPMWARPDDDELALMVERARPEFKTRLIAAVQLPRPEYWQAGGSPELARATIRETESVAEPMSFADIVSTRRMKKLVGLAGMVLLLGIIGMGAGRDVTFDLMKRAFLSNVPVPRKTQVDIPNGDHVIGRGDAVVLQAYANGVRPAEGRVVMKYKGRRNQEHLMPVDPENRSRFVRTIENVQESFTYVVYLNDGRSRRHTVKAVPRPTVVSVECLQRYPDYTGLAPARRPLGDLSLLAGSSLDLRISTSKAIESAMIKPVGTNVSAVDLTVDPDDPKMLTGQIPIPAKGLTGFSVEMTDKEGMTSVDAAVYRVEIIPDKPPVVRITAPLRKEELVTRDAQLPVGMHVEDDFQVGKVKIRYKVDTREELGVGSVEMDLSGETPDRLIRRFVWELNQFDPILSEGTVVEFWLEAEDNNDATGPGIGVSEHQLARIVTRDEKRAELLNRAGDAFASIDDATNDQEKLNKRLGEIILQKVPSP